MRIPQPAGLLLAACWAAMAQQIPLRHYDTASGLVFDEFVEALYQDSKGFLWIGTHGGVSRFDGYSFKNYGPLEGLERPVVHGFAEDERGFLWMAALNGAARLALASPEDLAVWRGRALLPRS